MYFMQGKTLQPLKNLAGKMINYQSNRQLCFSDFALPFNGALDSNNRWVKLAYLLPWDGLVEIYARGLSCGRGRPTQDLRIELGTLIIQELMEWSDREVIAQIQENPYLQYFLGYPDYGYRKVFDPSLLVTIRKRLNRAAIAELTRLVAEAREAMEQSQSPEEEDKDDFPSPPSDKDSQTQPVEVEHSQPAANTALQADDSQSERRGQLILDATAAELEIPYPTDLGLLNEARLQSERIIDVLWSLKPRGSVKPRTYRQKARAAYLSVAKKRRKSRKEIRKGIKQQLQYLRRNIKTLDSLLGTLRTDIIDITLKRRDKKLLETIKLVYGQQKQMYEEKSRRIAHRIVNLYQPWVRPIKRGKSGSDVEFGPKLSVSLVDNVAYVDHFSWEAFHEGTYLAEQVAAYRKRHRFYPEVVIGDTIYGSHKNRQYLKSLGIRFSGKQLGRPVQVTPENRQQLASEKKQRKQEQCRRNRIEGCFGLGRRRYGLGRVRTRLEETSETSICMAFFAMSVAAYLAAYFVRKAKLWWRSHFRIMVLFSQ
ncbi:MAG: IS5 family transposase [Planctomycetota bacterium]|jgi:hypothetical protein